MIAILMMSTLKLAPLDFLEIKVFWKKGYNGIIFIHDVNNKILSRESNYIVDVVIWPKFGNYRNSMREKLPQQQFYKDLTRKYNFMEQCVRFKFNDLRLTLGITLNFFHQYKKMLKTKSQKVFGANSYVCRNW